ncbi:hypothetical protein CFC21_100771 [Triticum aestivum]|uniref:Uncharacterized protein n=2 Tax=Triticum aestivum TaxID=4565 RepID=A0A3B6RQ73_WHEAT|nr:hypothetical protein CFC21_100771 [Triticum aestivum]
MGARQEGHVAQVRSQASTHATWKPWPHRGSTRRASPSMYSARQIAHSDDEPVAGVGEGPLATKETVGSAWITFFLRPFGGGGASSNDEAERRRRHVHREMRARPRTQTSAHSNDARMSTMSELTAIGGAVCCCCSGAFILTGDDDGSPGPLFARAARCRRFAGARMMCELWTIYLAYL